MSTSPIIIQSTIPAEIPVLEAAVIASANELVATATAMTPKTSEDLIEANRVFKEIDALKKGIEAHRMSITRPIDALLDAIRAEERKVTTPLADAKERLGVRMIACEKDIKRLAAEAARKAREEAEEKARKEQARIDAIAAEEKRVRDAARAELEAKAKAEAEMFGTVAEELPPEPEIERKIIVPIVERAAEFDSIPVPKSAARLTTRMKLFIPPEAIAKIIEAACKDGGKIAGVPVLMVDPDAIEKLVKAGVPMHGAVMVPSTNIGAAGGRG